MIDPDRARVLASLYVIGDAAVPLLLVASSTSESPNLRLRARYALLQLDPDRPGPLEGPARAIADAIVETIVYDTDPATRATMNIKFGDGCE